MENVLIALIVGVFASLVFLNVYFRVKVLKVYKKLVQKRVQFGAKHLFNKEKMQEIYARYPDSKEDIASFQRHMRYSIRMATVLIFTITLLGAVLMYFR